jgi:predicted lipoprotein with Yx(FWY)xxD motif
MLKTKSRIALCAAVAAVAVPAVAIASSSTVIKSGKVKPGTVVVTSSGLTLYGFKLDSKTKSACTGTCTRTWIPLLTNGSTTVKPGSGLSQKLVGKVKRPNGKFQVTYGGHPLYRYVHDTKSGQDKGEGKNQFGGLWYVVSKSGKFLLPLVGGY